MKNLFKIIVLFSIFFLPLETKLFASDVYFVDYSKVMNQSTAGKKAQDNLKKLLNNSNKKFNETAKKLKDEENNIMSQRNALSKEEYKKKADALRKKVFELNKEREKSIREVATKRKKAGDEMPKNLDRPNPYWEDTQERRSRAGKAWEHSGKSRRRKERKGRR